MATNKHFASCRKQERAIEAMLKAFNVSEDDANTFIAKLTAEMEAMTLEHKVVDYIYIDGRLRHKWNSTPVFPDTPVAGMVTFMKGYETLRSITVPTSRIQTATVECIPSSLTIVISYDGVVLPLVLPDRLVYQETIECLSSLMKKVVTEIK